MSLCCYTVGMHVLNEVKRYEDGIKMFFYFSLNSFSIKIKVIFHVSIDRSYFLLCVVRWFPSLLLILYLPPGNEIHPQIKTTNSAQTPALSVVMFQSLLGISFPIQSLLSWCSYSHQPSTSFTNPACIQPAIHTVNITYLSAKNTHRELLCCMYLNVVNRLYVFFYISSSSSLSTPTALYGIKYNTRI